MKIIKDYNLSKSTTFHIGGIAKNLYIPESTEELIVLLNNELTDNNHLYILGGGSNLLINDNKIFENVIDTKEIDKSINNLSDGKYYIGCSNRIQNVVNEINKDGYGGFEELVSLPALFGGIIYMNAGIGSKNKSLFTISDFIDEVKVIDLKTKKIKWLKKEDCDFSHRQSIFQSNDYVILGANIRVNKQDIKKSKERIRARLEKTKKYERGKGCFGSCFAESNSKLLKLVSILSLNKNGVYQSKNNGNWLVNDGNGTFVQTMKIINKCKKIHKMFHKSIKCEVQIWE